MAGGVWGPPAGTELEIKQEREGAKIKWRPTGVYFKQPQLKELKTEKRKPLNTWSMIGSSY